MKFALLLASMLLTACPAILSSYDFAKGWVGHNISEMEDVHKRNGRSWSSVKRVSEDRTVYTSLDGDFDWGKCYVDFIVDSRTGTIVDYRVYGDEAACK